MEIVAHPGMQGCKTVMDLKVFAEFHVTMLNKGNFSGRIFVTMAPYLAVSK